MIRGKNRVRTMDLIPGFMTGGIRLDVPRPEGWIRGGVRTSVALKPSMLELPGVGRVGDSTTGRTLAVELLNGNKLEMWRSR